jgi:hypothetical protein
MDKATVERMDKFQTMMHELYNMAEGLRDCTADSEEKAVFNNTRRALYDLRDDARHLYYKWKENSPSK